MAKTQSPKKKLSLSALHYPVQPFRLWVDTATASEVKIDMIPLIDVIFCILIFFILAAVTFSRQQAISLDVPKAKTGTPQVREMLVISLDDFGDVYVDKEPVATSLSLQREINKYLVLNPQGLIVLNASKNVSYNQVIRVLDVLREVGGDRVALSTLPAESQLPVLLNPNLEKSLPKDSLNLLDFNFSDPVPPQPKAEPQEAVPTDRS